MRRHEHSPRYEVPDLVRAVGVLALALVVLLRGARAEACRGFQPCGAFLPFTGADSPANVPGLEWAWTSRGAPGAGAPALVLYRSQFGSWVRVEADVTVDSPTWSAVVHPREPLQAGAGYRLETSAPNCSADETAADFIASAPRPLPSTLGAVHASDITLQDVQQGPYTGPACADRALAAVVDVSVALSADAAPWGDVLYYEALIDGVPSVGLQEIGPPGLEPAPGGTFRGRGAVRLTVICGPPRDDFGLSGGHVDYDAGLREGVHEVAFRARVAGTSTWVETPTTRVGVWCAGPRAGLVGGIGCGVSRLALGASGGGGGARTASLTALLGAGAMGARRRRRRGQR